MDDRMNKNVNADKKEVKNMPTMEMFETERTAYINELEQYLYDLKKMPISEAKKKAKQNLVECQILTKKGKLTAKYK